ncbi:MAG TPA: hypothetical protein VMK42_18630 [Anaeromyxobacteraceae bacterium]|nr:hypothetical protein [Anaeromyxobacteraceae bacterium]
MAKNGRVCAAAIPFALLLACTDAAKAPAEAAMKAAGEAVSSLKGDAEKFAPDTVRAVEASYASAKDLVAKQDYQGALAVAQGIPTKAKEALAAAAAKKDELVKAWNEVLWTLPNMLSASKARVEILTRARRLPANLDKATLEKAKAELAAIEAGWSKASAEYAAGGMAAAVSLATDLKARARDVMMSLGL